MVIRHALLIACCFSIALTAVAQNDTQHVPDVLALDGTGGVAFTSHPILDLSAQGTIEFWVAADWTETLDFDPTVLSNVGQQGAAYHIAIAGDRQSIFLQTADRIVDAEYDFSDGALHHVAFINFGDEITLVVNGQLIAQLAMSIEELPTQALWVGANVGNNTPFTGVIAGLRIWRSALLPDVIADYALRPITSQQAAHPEINELVGHSAFAQNDFYITEAVLIPPLESVDE